jgi:cell division transport system ATP-binding protein
VDTLDDLTDDTPQPSVPPAPPERGDRPRVAPRGGADGTSRRSDAPPSASADRASRRPRGRPQVRGAGRGLLRPGDGPMVVFDAVTKTYDETVVGLEDVSLTIDAGEFVFLVGASGSGKSTFIRLVIKELEPTAGGISVGGRDLTVLRRKKVPYLRREIGCVFQDFKLLPNRTAHQNVAYALEVTGESPRSIRRKVPEILSLVGLADKADRRPGEMSGGEQQRISIARAFVNHPAILIADEPTGNLDPLISWEILQLLLRINELGVTVMMATHNAEVVTALRKRVVALEEGRIIRDEVGGAYHRED